MVYDNPNFLSLAGAEDVLVSFPAFLQLLKEVAVAALSKPMFAHLYPSESDKVLCLNVLCSRSMTLKKVPPHFPQK